MKPAESEPVPAERTDEPKQDHRLDTWKDIATHFGKGVSTVQRWEKEEGLPVRRHAHAKKGSVYALRDEVDAWRQSRAEDPRLAEEDMAEDEAPADLPSTPSPRHQLYATVATIGALAILFAFVKSPLLDGSPLPGGSVPAQEQPLLPPNWPALARCPLQGGTATFSQAILGGPFSPSQAIDRYFIPSSGWTIARETADAFGSTRAETAVWETVGDVHASHLTFNLHFLHFNGKHLLGRFRFSVTDADRSVFADEAHTDGQVDAPWVVLEAPIVSGPQGMTFTTLKDHSVLVGGSIADQGVYSVSFRWNRTPITGIRLEALQHPSLPGGGGPGLYPASGNFFLTEIEMFAADAGAR